MSITDDMALEQRETNLPSISFERTNEISTEILNRKSIFKIRLEEWAPYLTGTVAIASEFTKAMQTSNATKGLYRCVFPPGATGSLQRDKVRDAFLGAIVDSKGVIRYQARWISVPKMSALSQMNIASIIAVIAVTCLKQLVADSLQMEKNLFEYIKRERRSELDGAFENALENYEKYQYYSNKPEWKKATAVSVKQAIKDANQFIKKYYNDLREMIDKQNTPERITDPTQLRNAVLFDLAGYQRSIQLYALNSFLEALLNEDISDTAEEIEQRYEVARRLISTKVKQFQDDYADCYSTVRERYLSSPIQTAKDITTAAISWVEPQKNMIDAAFRWTTKKRSDCETAESKKNKSYHDIIGDFMKPFSNIEDIHIDEFEHGVRQIRAFYRKEAVLMIDGEYAYVIDEPQFEEAMAEALHEE